MYFTCGILRAKIFDGFLMICAFSSWPAEFRECISNLSKCTIKNNVGDKKQVYGETSDSLLTLLPVRLVYHSFGP